MQHISEKKKKTSQIPDVNIKLSRCYKIIIQSTRGKRNLREINFKREIQVKRPILFFAKLQETGYFSAFLEIIFFFFF